MLAAETHRAERGQLNLAHLVALTVVDVGVARSVAVVGEDKLVVGHLCAAQHPLLLWHKVGEVIFAQMVGIVGANLILRRTVVGVDIDFAVLDADGAVGIAHVAGQAHIVRVAVFQVLDPQLVAIAIAHPAEEVALVIRHGDLVEQQRLALVL